MMNRYQELLGELETLQAERARISGEGEALQDCWLSQSKPGGSARSQNLHWQLRSRQPIFDGKKSKYLKPDEVAVYQTAIERGRQIKALDKQIAQLQQKLDRANAVLCKA
jgi:hypothetical protein